MAGTLEVWALGDPIPQGSKTVTTRTTASGRTSARMYEANPRLRPWRATMREAIQDAMTRQDWQRLEDVPIRVTLTFTLPAPLAVAAKIRKQGGRWPAWRGYDLDKCARAALDALTDAGAIDDDSRVSHLLVRKVWAGSTGGLSQPGVMIEVREQRQ